MNKKVLITGGAGFIGSHTADLLFKKNYEVTILDSLNPKSHGSTFPDYLNKNYTLVQGNILDEKLMDSLLSNTDYVVHLAAEMDLNPDFKLFMDVNVGGTALIYEIITKKGYNIKKILIASSQFVYGEGIWECIDHGKFSPANRAEINLEIGKWDHVCPICGKEAKFIPNIEEHANPGNHYSLSKYFQELLSIKLGLLYNIPTVAIRYSIVHGPRQSLKNTYSGALRNFAISLKLNKELATFEDNNSERDFVSVFDVANANVFLLESREVGVFNLGGKDVYAVSLLAQIIAKKMNKKYKFSSVTEYRIGDIRHAISSSNKLLNIGWDYISNEEEALTEYIEWFTKQEIDIVKFEQTQKNIRTTGVVKKIKAC
jgi:dTDP-L-rhamnose 4-epimerase